MCIHPFQMGVRGAVPGSWQTWEVGQLKLRDRIYNRKVAHAMTSPLGIMLAGGGAAVGIALGLPIIVAVGIGAAAWAARVATAMPRGLDLDGIDPFVLADPWRAYVWKAKRSKRAYFDAVKQARNGPLQDRLEEIAGRIETGVAECWAIAQSGQALTEARGRIDTTGIQRELTQINWNTTGPPAPGSSKAETMDALQSQLETAARLDQVIADTDDRLRLLDARLDEAVTRAIELSARGQRVDELGSLASDVDSVVHDMESLRLALDETDQMTSGESGFHWPPRDTDPGPAIATSAGSDTASLGVAGPSDTGRPEAPTPGLLPEGMAERLPPTRVQPQSQPHPHSEPARASEPPPSPPPRA